MAVAIALFAGVLGADRHRARGPHEDRAARRDAGAARADDRAGAAIEAVDCNTIGLLVGMMLMVRLTEPTGVYTWLAIRAGQLSERPPARRRSLARGHHRAALGLPGQPDHRSC